MLCFCYAHWSSEERFTILWWAGKLQNDMIHHYVVLGGVCGAGFVDLLLVLLFAGAAVVDGGDLLDTVPLGLAAPGGACALGLTLASCCEWTTGVWAPYWG